MSDVFTFRLYVHRSYRYNMRCYKKGKNSDCSLKTKCIDRLINVTLTIFVILIFHSKNYINPIDV